MALRFDEKGKFYTEYVSKNSIPVTIQMASFSIRGCIHVRKDQRLSDEINRPDPFIPVTDVTVYDATGGVVSTGDFLAVNRAHIVWIRPEGEPPRSEEPIGEV